MTLEELCHGFYEDLNGRIVTVGLALDSYNVFFECDDWNDSDWRRRFELVFNDVPESTATPSASESLAAVADHPILWQHNEEHTAIFFSSTPANPMELMGLLYEVHERLFAGWRRMGEYLHADSTLLAGGHGLLAQGPRSVIAEYSKAIDGQLRYTVIPCHTPRGGYRVILFDECYVVFRDVKVVEHIIA
ncbi:MAG: hypothetical protein WD894_16555 [Pirellulales bacterium]